MISEDIQKQNETFERYKERVTNFSNNFEIGLFVYLLKKSALIYILIFALAIASGYLYIRYTDPIYESDLIMQINKKDQAGQLLNVYSSFMFIKSVIFLIIATYNIFDLTSIILITNKMFTY